MSSRSVLFVLVAACAEQPALPPEPPPAIGPQLGSTHVLRSEATTPPPPAIPPPPSANGLLAAVNELAVVTPDGDQLAHAMRRLADALEVVTPASADEIVQVRRSADAVERAPARKQAHIVRAGLEHAARALDQLTVSARASDVQYGTTVIALRTAAQAIDPDQPLAEQYTRVRGAFRAAVRAVFAANGTPAPQMTGEASTALR